MEDYIKSLGLLADSYAKNRDLYFAEAVRKEKEIESLRVAGNQFAGAYDAVIAVIAVLKDPEKLEAIIKELNGGKNAG